jgi:hypothetical protein
MTGHPTTFSLKVRKELQSYVYVYLDPRDGAAFYVGQGKNNRVFDHLKSLDGDTPKAIILRELNELKIKPKNRYIAPWSLCQPSKAGGGCLHRPFGGG